jgi:uncharacterized membrane protein
LEARLGESGYDINVRCYSDCSSDHFPSETRYFSRIDVASRIDQALPGKFHRRNRLLQVAKVLAVLLPIKIFLSIVLEYRHYFPADFDTTFLVGREAYFNGTYSFTFYAHIVASPIALVGCTILMFSGGRKRFSKAHRWLGRIQALIVLGVVAPSGFVMAQHAFAGSIAEVGLGTLAFATAFSMALAVRAARQGNIRSHQQWATRCYILLFSPLLLRLASGIVIVTGLESDWLYRLNAWGSWLVPIVSYEIWLRRAARRACPTNGVALCRLGNNLSRNAPASGPYPVYPLPRHHCNRGAVR